MEESSAVDPLSIDKDSELIKGAQEDIRNQDILVCGSCHEVYHFIEQFQEHKAANDCSKSSAVKENCHGEPKPQVWAFMLWKNAHYKEAKEGRMPSSWEIYQLWCKLDAQEKGAWIAAGKNIQTFSKLSDAKLVEVKVKPQVYGGRRANQKVMVTVPSLVTVKGGGSEEDPLDEGEIRLSQLPEAQRMALKAQAEANKVSDDADPLGDTETADVKGDKENEDVRKPNDLIKRGIIKPVQLNSDVTILPSNKKQNNKEAVKTSTSDARKQTEFAVEKIVSKRYNPKKKTFEYLIKWENTDKNEYTWEPAGNLDSCKALVEEYEVQLKKQRLQKSEAAALQKQYEKKNKKSASPSADILEGRPQRSSKQKALNQVKAWCGDISDVDEESSKRKFSDDDSDTDSFEKKMKLDDESDSDDEDKPTVTIKKVQKTNSVNGVGKKPPPIGKILIPDSKGIVRINQKQASELSSGVYIMSKTAGIIKLDSNTSKFATSGGQAIVKVEPRIGQTQIKVVKRDPAANTVKLTPKAAPKPKITLKAISTPKAKKEAAAEKKPSPSVSIAEKKDSGIFPPAEDEESSDDGIPDMEFPTDLPLPEPESPPGDFVLDPETGKIAGVEYPPENEKPVVISVEEPKQEEQPADVKMEDDGKEEAKSDNLENLVKLAAADILDDELGNSSEEAVKEAAEPPPVEKPEVTRPVAQIMKPKVTSTPVKPTGGTSGSILQRKLLSTPRQSGGPSGPTTTIRKVTPSPLKRNTPVISPVRGRTVTAKPRQYIPANTPTITRVRQSYSNKNMNVHKKIGQTTIYRTVPQKPARTAHQIIHPQSILQQHHQAQQKQRQEPIVLNTEAHQAAAEPPTTSAEAAINVPLLSVDEQPAESQDTGALSVPEGLADLMTLAELNDAETPLIVTGEDGTIYQVAGQNEQGQTVLVTQGADGQSQCLVVATEEEGQVVQVGGGAGEVHGPMVVEEGEVTGADGEAMGADAEESMVAQLISADPPSPGGRRNVTVMLPDGTCVTMVVTQEQYESLELDK